MRKVSMKNSRYKELGKALALLLVLLVSVGAFAGCGAGTGKNTEAATGDKPAASAQTGAPQKVFTYTMVMSNFGPWDEKPEMVEYWEKYFGNVKFVLKYVESAGAADKINLMVASGDIPDVLQSIDQQKFFEQGVIGGWEEQFFRKNAPRLAKYVDSTDATAWNLAKFDGKLMYSIPGFRLYNTQANPVIWRDDWLKKLGINEIPQKLSDVEAAFYKIADNDPDGNGKKDTFGLSNTGMDSIYGAFGSMRGIWIKGDDGKVAFGDVLPGAKAATELLRKWYKDGVLDPEFVTGENQGGYWAVSHAFLKDRIGYTGMGSFYHWTDTTKDGGTNVPNGTVLEWKKANKAGTFRVGYPPIGPDNKRGTKMGDFRTLRTTFSKNLVKEEDKFARLLQVVDEMNCKDVETSLTGSRGMIGKYSMITNELMGVPSYKSLLPNNVTDLAKLSAIGAANTFAFIEEGGNMEYQKVVYAQDFVWVDKYYKDKSFPYVNAVFGALPSQTKYKAELDKILNEGFISMIAGDKPMTYFEEMTDKWKKAGGDQLTKEANELYTRQKAK